MRSDKALGDDFRNSQDWKFDIRDFNVSMATVEALSTEGDSVPETRRISNSFSGHERNHLFINRERGHAFTDVSPLSGLDDSGDGRSFAYLDYDRNGWPDIVLVNANRPFLSLFKNDIASASGRGPGRFVAVRFEGGNRAAKPSDQSPRDGYGAKVRLRAGDLSLIREHRCGDGFAAQNSETMLIGIGDHDAVDSLVVDWPSGARHDLSGVAAGTLVTAWEDPAQSPTGVAFEQVPYRLDIQDREFTPSRPWSSLDLGEAVSALGELNAFVTMATWCEACKRYQPQVEMLRRAFGADRLGLYGAPIDLADDTDKLTRYAEQHKPAYHLLTGLDPAQRQEVARLVRAETGGDGLPTTLVTDRSGRVVAAFPGVPSVSEIARLLD